MIDSAGTCYLLPFFWFWSWAASAAPAFMVRAFASSAPTAKFRTGPFLAVPFFGTNVLGRWWFFVVANEGMEGTGSHFQWLGGEILLDPICRHLSPSLITE